MNSVLGNIDKIRNDSSIATHRKRREFVSEIYGIDLTCLLIVEFVKHRESANAAQMW